MNKLLSWGLAGAAVVVLLIAGSQFFGLPGGLIGSDPSATPEPTTEATTEPTPSGAGSLPVGSSHVLWDGQAGAAPDLGIKITVPIPADGWFGDAGSGTLKKNDNLGGPDGAGVIVFAETNDLLVGLGDLYVYGDPCHWASTKPDTPVKTVDEAIAALAAQPSRDASTPVEVTYDGYSGKYITLHVPDDAVFSDCDRGQFRTLVQNEGRDSARIHEAPGQSDVFTVLDVYGEIMIFDAVYYDGTPDAVFDEIATIVTSATIDYSP
jgi:hypothetical protein